MVIAELWGGNTNARGIRLSGSLLVCGVRGGSSANNDLLMGIWWTVMVARMIDHLLALLLAREVSSPRLLLFLLFLVLSIALFIGDSNINSLMIGAVQDIRHAPTDLWIQASDEAISLLAICVDMLRGILREMIELTHIQHHRRILLL